MLKRRRLSLFLLRYLIRHHDRENTAVANKPRSYHSFSRTEKFTSIGGYPMRIAGIALAAVARLISSFRPRFYKNILPLVAVKRKNQNYKSRDPAEIIRVCILRTKRKWRRCGGDRLATILIFDAIRIDFFTCSSLIHFFERIIFSVGRRTRPPP
jgi:hypothetical protein